MDLFYVADNGEMPDPPHWLKQSQEKLAKLQRRLSRMEPGSKNYAEAVQKYREFHEHIANQRRDFIHKESSRIANGWGAVCVRADDLAELSRGVKRGNILEFGYGMFRECLRYKLERQGKQMIQVDRYQPTTRTCSVCGLVRDEVPLKAKIWVCPKCNTVHQKEINAAKNIKALGLAQYFNSQELRESA